MQVAGETLFVIKAFKRLFGRRNRVDENRSSSPDAITQILDLAQEVRGESGSRGELLHSARRRESLPLPGLFDPFAYQIEKKIRQARENALPSARTAAWWDRQLPET